MPIYDAVDHLLVIQECNRIIICWFRCKLLLRLKIRWLCFKLVVFVFLMEVPMSLVHFIFMIRICIFLIKFLGLRVITLKRLPRVHSPLTGIGRLVHV